MIRTFVDGPTRAARSKQAALKERVLYAEPDRLVRPADGRLLPRHLARLRPQHRRAVVRSPEHAFPVPNFDGSPAWTRSCSAGRRPRARRRSGRSRTWSAARRRSGEKTRRDPRVLDNTASTAGSTASRVNGVEHNLGFNLFEQVPFIEVPGEPWNHGAVEQSVNLVEAGNALYSLMMQAMIENVFPRLILEDPMKFDETIDFGPGATIGVNPGGKAYFLVPPTGDAGAGGGDAAGERAGDQAGHVDAGRELRPVRRVDHHRQGRQRAPGRRHRLAWWRWCRAAASAARSSRGTRRR
jgi:hypothetical protein